MEIIVLWIMLSILVAVFADNKGQSGAGFFFLSLFLSPLIGFVAVLVTEPNKAAVEARQLRGGASKKCPYCAELIKTEAVICRYCGKEQEPAAQQDAAKPATEPESPEPAPEAGPAPEQPLITDRYRPKPRPENAPGARRPG